MSHQSHASRMAESIAGRNLTLEGRIAELQAELSVAGQALVDISLMAGGDHSDWDAAGGVDATDPIFRRHLIANPHEVVEDVRDLAERFATASTTGTKHEGVDRG